MVLDFERHKYIYTYIQKHTYIRVSVCLQTHSLAAGSAERCPNRASGLHKRPATLPLYFFLTPKGEHSTTLGHVYEGIILMNFNVRAARWALQTFAKEEALITSFAITHPKSAILGFRQDSNFSEFPLPEASLELTSWPETPHPARPSSLTRWFLNIQG